MIRYNTLKRNAVIDVSRWMFGAAILNQNSRDVEIHHNTLEANGGGISAVMQNRTAANSGKVLYGYTAYTIDNFYVHDNTVKMTMGLNGVGQDISDLSWFTSHGVRYRANTYYLGPVKPFAWQNATRSDTEWKNYGQDTIGSFIR